MNNEYSTYDLFFRFENNTLNGDELKSFQQKLESDAVFRQEYKDYKLSGVIVITHKLYEVKKQLDKFDYSNVNIPNETRNYWKYILIGISVALLIATGYYFYQRTDSNKSVAPEKENKINTSISVESPTSNLNTSSNNSGRPVPSNINSLEKHIESPDVITQPLAIPGPLSHTPAPTNDSNVNSPNKENTNSYSPPENPKTNPCESVSITAGKITPQASCSNAISGQITLSEISGGTAPYHCVVNHKNYAKGEYTIPYLSAGEYLIQISDAKDCISTTYIVEIGTKDCSTDYSIQPDAGIFWNHVLSSNGATLTIQNKQGSLVMNKKIDGLEYTWEGADQYGNMLAPGIYFYRITYLNGEKESGTITIIQ